MIRQPSTPQQAEIRRSLELLHEPGDTFEIRILDACGRPRAVDAGYFNDMDAAAEAAAGADRAGCGGCYVTLNPCNPALLARANNRLIARPKHTTADHEITRRRWILLDVDADRPSGIAATDDEKEAATILAADVEDALRARGWSYPLICDSGNGHYLLFRVDAPNDDTTTDTLKRFLAGLNTLFDDGWYQAHVDVGVFNAARIIRVGGTSNRKGDDTADRPHRKCTFNEPIDECPVEENPWD